MKNSDKIEFNYMYDRSHSTWAKARLEGPILQSGEIYDRIGVKIVIDKTCATWKYDDVTEYGQETHLSGNYARITRDKLNSYFDFVRLLEIYNNAGKEKLDVADSEYLQSLAGHPIDLGIIDDDYRGDENINEWIRSNFNGID